MCGICGVIDFGHGYIQAETLRQMCKTLAHRGPDDEGMLLIRDNRYVELGRSISLPSDPARFEVGLGHRRLSIIDLSEIAHQPMSNEDGTIWVVFNGEIYNFREIQPELEERGHHFKSKSDTEVILHAYEAWGVECLKRFRGMFAFALWDSRRKRLFMARDRLGEKPLVYAKGNGKFAFASEIKALLQVPWITRKVNVHALHDYLTLQYVPSPDSIFEGIYKLPPAHYLIMDRSGDIKVDRYWKLRMSAVGEKRLDLNQTCGAIREKVEESVRLRLISDVPVGAFLSGGIDSSLIVGVMANVSGKPVQTFSIGFEEKEFDELVYARMVAKHFSTDHHEFIVKPDAIDILPKLVWHYNEPFADSSTIPTYYVARLTRDYVKVVLTGDAGDENFAGYKRYLRSKWVACFSRIPEKMRRMFLPSFLRLAAQMHWKEKTFNRLADFVAAISSSQVRNYAEQIKMFNEGEKEDLYSPEFIDALKSVDSFDYLVRKYDEAGTEDLIDQLLYLDINTYLPEDLLVKMDIATMANSLEARVPFLDHPLMEFVASLPSNLKLKGNIAKYVLKKSYSDFLPRDILTRKKMGFAVPISRWLRKELRHYMFDILLDRRTIARSLFRKQGIERLLEEHVGGRYDHSAKIWALLFLEIWYRTFMDQEVRLSES
jgi:asparagine synthase (glutamine-hydrolysing)